jgi:hypothetical protein
LLRDESFHWSKKRQPSVYCLNTILFWLLGQSLTHFISKYHAKKGGNPLIRGKLSSIYPNHKVSA